VREILSLIDEPAGSPIDILGRAVGALPPYVREADDYPRARAVIETLGYTYDARFAAVAQLESAIGAVQDAGLDWDENIARRYGDAMTAVAAAEVAPVGEMPVEQAIAYAILGTALFEPVMLALRRLAHQHLLVSGAVAAPAPSDEP